jgi:hypothetical protein
MTFNDRIRLILYSFVGLDDLCSCMIVVIGFLIFEKLCKS